MTDLIENFHLLRPYWLLTLLPGLLFALMLWRGSRDNNWRRIIDPNLLSALLPATTHGAKRAAGALLALGWCLAVFAASGPSWTKLPQPVQESIDSLVVLLDLSPSMNAQDLQPSRLEVAKRKLRDILDQRTEGLTALIAYAGDAHIVTPLTDDGSTIAAMLPALSPEVMPIPGDSPSRAVELGLELLARTGAGSGDFLLLSDGMDAAESRKITRRLDVEPVTLSVLGVAAPTGAPYALNGEFVRDENGDVVLSRLDEKLLSELARKTRGRYQRVLIDDSDIDALISKRIDPLGGAQWRSTERNFDLWRDQGVWFALALLPVAALGFRRGWLLVILLLVRPPDVYALDWADLWQTPDQRGANALEQDNPAKAAQLFKSAPWRGTALYRSGDFESASEAFGTEDNADADYNRGNALAKAGRLRDALDAYDAALTKQPDLTDAQFNRKLIEDLLSQQPQQQNQSNPSESPDATQAKNDNAGQSAATEPQEGQQDRNRDKQNQSGEGTPQSDAQRDNRDDERGRDQARDSPPAESRSERDPDESDHVDSSRHDNQSASNARKQTQPRATDAQREESADSEQQQALEYWLRQIPDDPAGLLRRKFEYETHQRMAERR